MGYAKRIYIKDMQEVTSEFTKYIKNIMSILPNNYEYETILSLLKQYYPHQWRILNEKYKIYCKKDKKLKSLNKKQRYLMPTPEDIIRNLKITQKLLSKNYKNNYKKKFNEDIVSENKKIFQKKRIKNIRQINERIEKAKLKTQQMEPLFLNKLIGLYDRKNTTQKDKVYIMLELKKYYCPNVVNFFYKKAQSEYNQQLRIEAVKYLHEFGHYAVLRKQNFMRIPSQNKKRRKYLKEVYAKETYHIKNEPEELEYRILNSKEQKLKQYDFFISHSSSDHDEVQKLIEELNKNNKDVYCDWINDNDYLKRHLVGDATKAVIEKRISQSKNILFVESDNSLNSKWVKYELNYCNSLNKSIYVINKQNIIEGLFKYNLIQDKWFIDEQYDKVSLF